MQKIVSIALLTTFLLLRLSFPTQAQTMSTGAGAVWLEESSGRETVATASVPIDRKASRGASCTAAPPTLLTPAAGSTSSDLDQPRYTWSIVPSISEYLIQIAESTDFTNPLESDNQHVFPGDSQVIHFSSQDLRTNRTYFWRVASVCADGQIGSYSAPISFQTNDTSGTIPCTLAPPTLLEPTTGSTVETLIPNLRWATAANVFEYYYEISLSPSFTRTYRSGTLYGVRSGASESTGLGISENLDLDTTYYWRVATICAELDTTGAFSAPFTFQTTTDSSNLPATGPDLLFPSDGATTGSIRVIIRYAPTADATGYRVEFANNQESAERGDWFLAVTTGKSPVVVVFNPEETLYWWVHARNEFGWGARSVIRTFTTPTDQATAEIAPESGGTLAPDPGYLTVTFPPGAVPVSTTVNFQLFATPAQPLPDFSFANRAFALTAAADGTPVTQFDEPYTMVLHYDEGDLLAAGITDPNKLNLLFWNGSAWEEILPCSGCAIDTTAQTVTVVLDHFTDFALVGPLPANVLHLPLIQR